MRLSVLLLLVACGPKAPVVAAPEVREAVEVPSDARLLSQSGVVVKPEQAALGAPVEVVYAAAGPNGCYHQSEVVHEIGDGTIVHRYTTWADGEICTMALVPGGFVTTVTPPAAGLWAGRVEVNGEVRATYTVTVSDAATP